MIRLLQTFLLKPDGGIPNNMLPLLAYKDALPQQARDAGACRKLFERNGWQGTWTDGIFDYWHFHITGHEVLGCVAGSATVGFGGDGGIKVEVEAGDVVVIPAGVGHKRFSEMRDGFTICGGYPPQQSGAITRPGDVPVEAAEAGIAKLALPASDPVFGGEGPLLEEWRARG